MSEQLRVRTGLQILASLAAFAASFGLGACFNGFDAAGLPCTSDAHCGSQGVCIEGFCGGLFKCGEGSLIPEDELCDGLPDCADDSDEDYALCYGDGDSFECSDGILIPVALTCDGEPLCLDESDEDPILCAGVGVNQCEGPDGDLGYARGPSAQTESAAKQIAVADFLGTVANDIIFTGMGGAEVGVVSFDADGVAAPVYFFNGAPPSFGTSTVVGFELGQVDSEGPLDLVIATTGTDDAGIYVFQNNAPMPPSSFGALSTVPVAVDAKIVGVELGKLDADDFSDIAVIVDDGVKGRVFVAAGDPTAAGLDEPYFTFDGIESLVIPYDTYLDSEMADIDDDGDDDLLVTGIGPDGGALWVVNRSGANGEGAITWETPYQVATMVPLEGTEIAVGKFGPMAPGLDVALLEAKSGLVQPVLIQEGMLSARGPVDLGTTAASGLTLADMNCDGYADFVFNVGNPAQVRVLLGDGMGKALTGVPVIYESDGTPSGGLVVTNYDADASLDIVSAVGVGGDVSKAEVRLLLTGL